MVVAAYVDPILAALPEVTDAVGTNRVPFDVVPPWLPLPACLYHKMGGGEYGGGIGGPPTEETLEFAVRFAVEGADAEPVVDAANAVASAFGTTAAFGDVTFRGVAYHVALVPVSEWRGLDVQVDINRFYRNIGSVYRAEVTTGG